MGAWIRGVSERNKDSLRNWARCHSCDTLVKNLASWYPCPENLTEVECGRNALMCSVKSEDGEHYRSTVRKSKRCYRKLWKLAFREERTVKELTLGAHKAGMAVYKCYRHQRQHIPCWDNRKAVPRVGDSAWQKIYLSKHKLIWQGCLNWDYGRGASQKQLPGQLSPQGECTEAEIIVVQAILSWPQNLTVSSTL